MAETIIERLRRELKEVPGLSEAQRDLLTSEAVIERVLPILSVITKAQVEEVQKVKDLTGEKVRELAGLIITPRADEGEIKTWWKEVQDGVIQGDAIEKIIENMNDHWFLGPILASLIAIIHIGSTVLSVGSVSSEKTRQFANKLIRPYLLDLETLMRWHFRQPGNEGLIFQEMEKLGLSDDKINKFIDMQYELLPLGVLTSLYLREQISEDEVETRLKQHKYHPEDLNHMKFAMQTFPNVQDLVRFGVREVFDPELVEQLGLMSDLPPDFITETTLAGLPEHYANMYWAAHWQPPPINQVFEMFHRGIIDIDEVNNLLRVNDYMPNYRDQLTQIAYKPLTRVDIRRIYEDGFIDFDQLVSGYMDLGNSEENSILLAQWADNRWGADRKDLSRTDILRMYDLGAYDRPTALEALISVGYNEDEAEELLLRNDLIRIQKERTNKIRIWKKRYIKKETNKEEIIVEMRSYGLLAPEINDLFVEWDIDITEKVTELSNTEIKQLFIKDFIDSDDTYGRLIVKGYRPNDAGLLVALWETGKETPEEG